jgi:hypothetical protein
MNAYDMIRGYGSMAIGLGIFCLPPTLIPPGLLAAILGIKNDNARWVTTPVEDGVPSRRIPYLVLSLLGGFAGGAVAVVSLILGVNRSCRLDHQACHDGQTGMVMMLTIPVFSLLGSSLALFWTWLSLHIPARHPWTSIFTYDGQQKPLNLICGVAIQLAFWAAITYQMAVLQTF